MNQLPTYSKLIVNHYTNKPLLTVTTIVHMTIYFIYHLPSEHMCPDICIPLHGALAGIYLMRLQSIWARIYALPFTACQLGNIMCLQSVWAGIFYALPFTVGWPGNITCLQSAWAGIYPLPFTAGRPGYIHSPSQRAGREISCAFRAHGPGYIHSPSQQAGREISCAFRVYGPGYITPLHCGPAKKYHMPQALQGPERMGQAVFLR